MTSTRGIEIAPLIHQGLDYIELTPGYPYAELAASKGTIELHLGVTPDSCDDIAAVHGLVKMLAGSDAEPELTDLSDIGALWQYGKVIERGDKKVQVRLLSQAAGADHARGVSKRIMDRSRRVARFVGSVTVPITRFSLEFMGTTSARAQMAVACHSKRDRQELNRLLFGDQQNATVMLPVEGTIHHADIPITVTNMHGV